MFKLAYENGALDALKRFGLEKSAAGMMSSVMSKGRSFLQGQAGALGQLGQGLHGMLEPGTAGVRARAMQGAGPATARMGGQQALQSAARGQAWEGLKGLAPTGAALGAGYLLSRGGDDQQQQPQRY